MFQKVKKGDILLVPQLPDWGKVSIAEATEDWDTGYEFSISELHGDYGHIFPAKFLKFFTRYGEAVTGNIRSTLHNPSRFWNISHFADDVDAILVADESRRSGYFGAKERVEYSTRTIFHEFFQESDFSRKLYTELNKQLNRTEWETALVLGLQALFPFYQVEKMGGPNEANHGMDILVRLPGILPDYSYAIAIQVKDYSGVVDEGAIKQVDKADNYFTDCNIKLIDKFVIYTKAAKENNPEVGSNRNDVHLIFARELEDLLLRVAKKILGLHEFDDNAHNV